MQDIGEAFRKARGSGARALVYPDGAQGTETDMVRRMRVGQLDVSLVTVVGLKEIDPSVAALQMMPLVFRSWEEVDFVRGMLQRAFEEKLAAKGFVVLFWGDAGWVRFFSKSPRRSPDDFRDAKIFAWAGDGRQVDLMKSLGYHPVSIPIADILPSLETGMIDTVPMVPIWALVGQFDRNTRYMLELPWAPIVGAAVMRKATFDALSPAVRDAVVAAAARAGESLRAYRVKLDDESVEAMKARGLQVVPPTPEDLKAWQALAEKAWPRIRGNLVPADVFDEVRALLTEFRSQKRP